jgi:hypothetical protein
MRRQQYFAVLTNFSSMGQKKGEIKHKGKGNSGQRKESRTDRARKEGWWTITIKGKRLRKGDKERRYQKDRRQCGV